MSNSLKFNPEYQKIVGGLWYDIKSKLERLNIPTLTSFLKLNEDLFGIDEESKLNSVFYIFNPKESATASIYHQLKKTIPPKKFSLLQDYFSMRDRYLFVSRVSLGNQ